MDDRPAFKVIATLLACASLLVLVFGVQAVFAQDIHVCRKDGKQIMTDRPCADLGAETKTIRKPESFRPLSGGGGLTDAERRMAEQYRQRDEIENQQRQAQIAQHRERASLDEAQNKAVCQNLDQEKNRIVAALRQNSTQWLNDRHRAVNDEMYRRRCETL